MTIWNPSIESIEGPRYQAIADLIEKDIREGRITQGFQLPTHRDLADTLGVTVGTVTRGYAEAARRGLLRGETGRGTYVGNLSFKKGDYFGHLDDTPDDAIDMGMTLPLNQLDPDLSITFSQLSQKPDLQNALLYYPAKGRLCDRETGAQWLASHHALPTHPNNVLISAGGQHAITVILSSIFRSGDTIAVDCVTYPLIKSLARRFNIQLHPIEIDDQGIVPEALHSACTTHKIHGVYCMPTIHNPLTAVMSADRRQKMAELVQKHNLMLIEDDAYALLLEASFTPISTLCPDHSFYIASLSKAVTSGLRFGYIVAPDNFVKRIELGIADTMWMASPLGALIARQWIQDGTAIKTIQAKRVEARHRNEMAMKVFEGYQIHSNPNGYVIWLELPEPWTATDFAKQASEQRAIVTPMENYLVGRQRPPYEAVRIAISGPTSHEQLKEGLEIVRNLLDEPKF